MEPGYSDNNPITPWESYATSWDAGMGDEGNQYFTELELPALKKLAHPKPGDRALELATGNGLVARWLAQEGASVFATDGSEAMVERAKARTRTWYEQGRLSGDNEITFRVLDVTETASWEDFTTAAALQGANDGFDIITMNMGIMDINDLEPLAAATKKLLQPDGRFVATLLHPIFFTSGPDRQVAVREDPATGERIIDQSIVLRKYLKVPPARQLMFSGDCNSKPPFLFHRPLHELFAPFFRAGLVLDALEEVNFDESLRDPVREYSAKNFVQFPKILAFRMRLLASS